MKQSIFIFMLAIIICNSIELSCSDIDRSDIDSIEASNSSELSTQSASKSHTQIAFQAFQQVAVHSYAVAAPIVYSASTNLLKSSSKFAQETVLPFIASQLISQNTKDSTSYATTNKGFNEDIHSDSNSDCDSESDNDDFTMVETTKKKKLFYRDQSELQHILKKNPEHAISKLNISLNSLLKEQNPESSMIQQDIFHLISLLKESGLNNGNAINIAPIIADEYNEKLKTILIHKIQDHATRVEPKIESVHAAAMQLATENRDRAIAKARKKYEKAEAAANQKRYEKLTKIVEQTKIIAQSSHYVNSCAEKTKQDHKAQQEDHYVSIEAYKKLLADV